MTGFYHHPTCLEHNTGPGHPERAARLTAIEDHLHASGLWDRLQVCTPEPAGLETIALIHPKEYIEWVEKHCGPQITALDADTIVSQQSFTAARLAAGAAVEAVDTVSAGEFQNAFCAIRPPGHHAETSRAMGFCLFNNIAVAATWLVREQRAERILIVDWDVHHGNGTQHIFYEVGEVFYLSLHQWPLYPGTGREDETGTGKGRGTTRNIPLNPDTSEQEYLDRFQAGIESAFQEYQPDFVLISAGFDAHRDDPLARLNLTESGFAKMTDLLLEQTDFHCDARMVSLLEGGYNLEALARSVDAHVTRLLSANREART